MGTLDSGLLDRASLLVTPLMPTREPPSNPPQHLKNANFLYIFGGTGKPRIVNPEA